MQFRLGCLFFTQVKICNCLDIRLPLQRRTYKLIQIMKKNRIILFIVWAFLFFSASAQPINFLSKLRVEDSLVLYADGHYGNFFNERLAEKNRHIMTKQELERLYQIFQDDLYSETYSVDENACAVFIEVHEKSGKKRGCFISEKWSGIVEESMINIHYYKNPKTVRTKIRQFINQYKYLMNDAPTHKTYDSLPLNMSSRRLDFTRCGPAMFDHAPHLEIKFYALQDSSIVFPIQYLVRLRKNKIKVWRKKIDLWAGDAYIGTDEDGLFLIRKLSGQIDTAREYASNEETDSLLNNYIPHWHRMTNGERMRLLDDCINH